MMKERYEYPAVFHYVSGEGIYVDFPDLPGCFAFGPIDEIAMEMAEEALQFHLYQMEQKEEHVPAPSTSTEIPCQEGDLIVQVKAWMPSFRNEMRRASIRSVKTISVQDRVDAPFPKEKLGAILNSA